MRNQMRRLGVLCLLGGMGFVGCSDSNGPEKPSEVVTEGEVADLKAKLPSGEEIEQAAGDAVDAVADSVSAAWEKASSAMSEFDGGSEMLGSMKEMYGSAKDSLSNVTSEESAEKAKAELDKFAKQLDEWKPKLSEMSDDTRMGVKRFFEYVAGRFSAMGEELNENEWVNEILKPKLRAVIEQLRSLV